MVRLTCNTHRHTHKSHRMFAGAAGCDPEIHISIVSCACLLNCMQNDVMSLISSTPKILKKKNSSVLGFCAENRVMLVPQSEHHPRIQAGAALWTFIDKLDLLIWWYLMKNGGESEEDFEHTHTHADTGTHTQTLNIKGTEGYCISRSGFQKGREVSWSIYDGSSASSRAPLYLWVFNQ